ncbi:hypothetical protein ACHWQZ_G002610 [Mnemiopsis leidyi]
MRLFIFILICLLLLYLSETFETAPQKKTANNVRKNRSQKSKSSRNNKKNGKKGKKEKARTKNQQDIEASDFAYIPGPPSDDYGIPPGAFESSSDYGPPPLPPADYGQPAGRGKKNSKKGKKGKKGKDKTKNQQDIEASDFANIPGPPSDHDIAIPPAAHYGPPPLPPADYGQPPRPPPIPPSDFGQPAGRGKKNGKKGKKENARTKNQQDIEASDFAYIPGPPSDDYGIPPGAFESSSDYGPPPLPPADYGQPAGRGKKNSKKGKKGKKGKDRTKNQQDVEASDFANIPGPPSDHDIAIPPAAHYGPPPLPPADYGQPPSPPPSPPADYGQPPRPPPIPPSDSEILPAPKSDFGPQDSDF